MRVFYFGCELLYSAAQAWLVLQLADGIFEAAWTDRRKNTGQAALIALMALARLGNSMINGPSFSNAMLIAGILIMAMGSAILYICSFWDAVCLNMLGLTGLALGDFIAQAFIFPDMCTFKRKNAISAFSPARGLYLLAWTVLMIFTVLVWRRWIAGKRLELLGYRKAWYALTFPVLLSMICLQILPVEVLSRWAVFLLCCILLFLLLWMSMVKHGAEAEGKILQMRTSMLESQYQRLSELYNERAILVHDLKNHLRAISTLLDREKPDEAMEYISRITRELEKGKDINWCNHEMMNLVLNMKFREAEKAQIQVDCNCDDMSGLALTSVEVCALFSNLLDNAIEANEKCPAGLERRINLLCARREKMLIISLSNSMAKGMENGMGKQFFKTAGVGLHGFGMRSVQKVIDSYHGYMKVDVRDNEFSIVIYLAAFDGA